MTAPLERIDSYRNELPLREQAWEIVAQTVAGLRGTSSTMACIVFDLDHFLSLVEAIGGDQGQRLLVDALEQAGKALEGGRVLSYGRDEILALMPVRSIEDALFRTETARKLISAGVRSLSGGGDGAPMIGCSAGVALYPTHAQGAIELIGKAEEGLYCAKRAGRDCTKLPAQESMVLKSNYYSVVQLERLANLAKQTGRTEESLLREALDRFLRSYDL